MNEQRLSPQEREKIKGSRMEYAFMVEDAYAHLPLLGSVVRALGKDWSMQLEGTDDFKKRVVDLQNQLVKSDLIRMGVNPFNSDLVLIDGSAELTQEIRNDLAVLGKSHVMAIDQNPDESYDLISRFSVQELSKNGVTAITGTGKGKTTSALGIAAEALAQGGRVAAIQ